MNKILMVDDDKDFIKTFNQRANKKGYELFEANSFEGLKVKIKEVEHKIGVIILDIKCLLRDDQTLEDKSFITQALKFLDTYYSGFPRVILTGDKHEFETIGSYYTEENIFLKHPDDYEKLFQKIKEYCDNSENLQIKRMYPDVFEIFELGLMDSTQETNLINILKNIDETNPIKFKGLFVNIRSIQETMYKQIHLKKPAIVPLDKIKSDGMIDFNKLMAHLNGNLDKSNGYKPTTTIYQSNSIHNISNGLYRICGEYIHGNIDISHYTLKSLIYNLLELLIWAKPHLK